MIDYARKMMTGETLTPGDAKFVIVHQCACGAAHRLTVGHYDRVRLNCGRLVWALQPKAYGPLEIFPWPGPPMTAREFAERESDQRADDWAAGRWAA
jgi:hypothetical protein